jgi:TatD DNase family protein
MPLVDTHCHLDFNLFDSDRLEILNRAHQAGLKRIINPGIDVENSRTILHLSDQHPELFAAVGVHPNSALTWNEQTLRILRELAQHPKVVAIGEIGLDFYRDRAPKEIQLQIFRTQLGLADELGLPVIIHSRRAETETVDILTEWLTQRVDRSSPPGVLHSYGGDEVTAYRAIHLGFHIGFTGVVTFKNAISLQKLAAEIPLSSILVETDAPFLTPHPHRGKRNEPAYVRLVAEKIASLKNLAFEVVSDSTTANAEQLFKWRTV